MYERRRCIRDIVRYCCRERIRIPARAAISPPPPIPPPPPRPMSSSASCLSGARGALVGLSRVLLVEGLGHRGELQANGRNDLRREEPFGDRDAPGPADRVLQVTRPDMLDEHHAGRASRLEGGADALDLRMSEAARNLAISACVTGRRLAVPLELEAEEGADDRAEFLALDIERHEVAVILLADEEEVEQAHGPAAFEPGELGDDLALEVRIRPEAHRDELNRTDRAHVSPPSMVV